MPVSRSASARSGRLSHPELAVPAVAVELVAAVGARRARPHVQHRLVSGTGRLHDEHVAGLVLAGQAGQPGIGAVRAEAVVAVVAADLQLPCGHEESLTGETGRKPRPASRHDLMPRHPEVPGQRGRGPVGGHEGGEFETDGKVVAAGVEARGALGHLGSQG